MRLTKIKLAGFKSFVDPTNVSFPSNLTGVVGPNGCGKSNVIDAVRWVMGELSAKHLRGESMADVIFNGSAARKPVGAASVELRLRQLRRQDRRRLRQLQRSRAEAPGLARRHARAISSTARAAAARTSRSSSSAPASGSRSYAIIEQGMISRVIEAKPDDMRAFVEEAAGISRYKERRKETESRVAETRENLERLQDVRDEIEKQIRHLQRQAATARRYQALKEQERRLTAEVLALRLRELDSGAEIHDSAMRERELAMQAALADQRAAEAAIEKQRAFHTEQSERVAAVQGRYYEVGAEISRTEQTIQHTRELRERQKVDLAQARGTLNELALHIERDERELAGLQRGARSARAAAGDRAGRGARRPPRRWRLPSRRCRPGSSSWEEFNRDARRRAPDHAGRARAHRAAREPAAPADDADRSPGGRARGARGAERARAARGACEAGSGGAHGERAAGAFAHRRAGPGAVAALRADCRRRPPRNARAERERMRAELLSLEALQKAALSHEAGKAGEWLGASGLAARPRVAEMLEVESGLGARRRNRAGRLSRSRLRRPAR